MANIQHVEILSAATSATVTPDTKREQFGIKMKSPASTVMNVPTVLISAVTTPFVSTLMVHIDAIACQASNVVLGDQIFNHAQVD